MMVRARLRSCSKFWKLITSAFSIYLHFQFQPLSSMFSLELAGECLGLTDFSSTAITKIWTSKESSHESKRPKLSNFARGRFVYHQLRSQFSHDVWWLSIAILLITVTESDHFKTDPLAFSTFNIIFECISAYSCVGVTVGFPGQSFAFCGAWHKFSKLLLIAISLRGRHRGLSVIIDHAALFPEPQGDIEENVSRQGQSKHVDMNETPLACV